MTGKQLRRFIINNKVDCALLLGNGINRYAQTGCSWETLLKALAKAYCPKLSFDSLPNGISNTEFFDILEIAVMKEIPTFDKNKLLAQDVKLANALPKEILERISQEIQEYTTKPLKPINLKDDYKLKRQFVESNSMVDMEMAMTFSTLGDKISVALRSKLVASICSLIQKWSFAPIHKGVSSFALKYQIPILGANYDNLLAQSIDAELHNLEHDSFSETFPISSCFTKTENPDFNKFGIWHINGMIQYPKSILIGLSHYMRSLDKIRELLLPQNEYDAELFQGNCLGFNSLKQTWLNLIFSRHLFIIGLSLDRDEILIRWLLLERAKYFSLYPNCAKKGYYIISETEHIDEGKKYFLNNIGFEIVRLPSYDAIYKLISA